MFPERHVFVSFQESEVCDCPHFLPLYDQDLPGRKVVLSQRQPAKAKFTKGIHSITQRSLWGIILRRVTKNTGLTSAAYHVGSACSVLHRQMHIWRGTGEYSPKLPLSCSSQQQLHFYPSLTCVYRTNTKTITSSWHAGGRFSFLCARTNPRSLLKTGRGGEGTAEKNVMTKYRLGKIRVKKKGLSVDSPEVLTFL